MFKSSHTAVQEENSTSIRPALTNFHQPNSLKHESVITFVEADFEYGCLKRQRPQPQNTDFVPIQKNCIKSLRSQASSPVELCRVNSLTSENSRAGSRGENILYLKREDISPPPPRITVTPTSFALPHQNDNLKSENLKQHIPTIICHSNTFSHQYFKKQTFKGVTHNQILQDDATNQQKNDRDLSPDPFSPILKYNVESPQSRDRVVKVQVSIASELQQQQQVVVSHRQSQPSRKSNCRRNVSVIQKQFIQFQVSPQKVNQEDHHELALKRQKSSRSLPGRDDSTGFKEGQATLQLLDFNKSKIEMPKVPKASNFVFEKQVEDLSSKQPTTYNDSSTEGDEKSKVNLPGRVRVNDSLLLDNFLLKSLATQPKRNTLHRPENSNHLKTIKIKRQDHQSTKYQSDDDQGQKLTNQNNSSESTEVTSSATVLQQFGGVDRSQKLTKFRAQVSSQSPVRALQSLMLIDQLKQNIQNSQKMSPSSEKDKKAVSSLSAIKDSANLQEIIDKMSLPAVQAHRDKAEKISFRRPTQNPPSKRILCTQEQMQRKRDESSKRFESKKKLLQQKMMQQLANHQ